MKTIYKSGAIILNHEGKMLIAHKSGKPENEFIVPGGKLEAGESADAALHRELLEELDTQILTAEFYADFQAKAIYDECWLVMHTYRVTLKNTPKANGEIDKIVWVGKDFDQNGFSYASILGKQLLPRLKQEGLLK